MGAACTTLTRTSLIPSSMSTGSSTFGAILSAPSASNRSPMASTSVRIALSSATSTGPITDTSEPSGRTPRTSTLSVSGAANSSRPELCLKSTFSRASSPFTYTFTAGASAEACVTRNCAGGGSPESLPELLLSLSLHATMKGSINKAANLTNLDIVYSFSIGKLCSSYEQLSVTDFTIAGGSPPDTWTEIGHSRLTELFQAAPRNCP